MSWFQQTLGAIKKLTGREKRYEAPRHRARLIDTPVRTQAPTPTGKLDILLGGLRVQAERVQEKYRRERQSKRERVDIGNLLHVTAGGRHAIYQSNIGLIRKPL
jgi:hypothetical protein